jgi:hypothetical protein
MKILLPNSGAAEVLFVNESRAKIRLVSRRNYSFETFSGQEVNIDKPGREFDISPNSECQILKEVQNEN